MARKLFFSSVNDALETRLHNLYPYKVTDWSGQLTELYKMLLCCYSALSDIFIVSFEGSNASCLSKKWGSLRVTKLESTWFAHQAILSNIGYSASFLQGMLFPIIHSHDVFPAQKL